MLPVAATGFEIALFVTLWAIILVAVGVWISMALGMRKETRHSRAEMEPGEKTAEIRAERKKALIAVIAILAVVGVIFWTINEPGGSGSGGPVYSKGQKECLQQHSYSDCIPPDEGSPGEGMLGPP